MLGCSVDEAFPDTAFEAGAVARKEERRKAKRCGALSQLKNGAPALAFLKAGGEGNPVTDRDPDRQHLNPIPPAIQLKGSEGFASSLRADQQPSNTQWIPKATSQAERNQQDLVKNLVGQRVDDVIGQASRNTLPTNLESSAQLPDPAKNVFGQSNPSYFGSDGSTEAAQVPSARRESVDSFADFSSALSDTTGYQLTTNAQADFLGTFAASALDKASGRATLSTPSINDAWKPLTPSGSRSSFFEYLPAPSGMELPSSSFSREEKEGLLKKLDVLFARLDDLEAKRNEYAHVEVSMFVLSGLFLIYGIDALRKF